MNRSPLFYPMTRGMDAEAGGAADLQTDVMRFMAIISMCLVAIFALVQSIPVVTPPPETVADDQEIESPPVEEPATTAIELTRPEPAKYQRPIEERVVLERPVPKPVERPAPRPPKPAESSPLAEAATPPAATASDSEATAQPDNTQKGFTLRFESDHALTRLVEQDIVGLYVIGGDGTHRMSIASDQPNFWSASAPARFHEMDAGTVPRAVLLAYERRSAASAGDARWGVSLPAAMSTQLNAYLNQHDGGNLVIGSDGTLRLEP
jgi:hypothetical protein